MVWGFFSLYTTLPELHNFWKILSSLWNFRDKNGEKNSINTVVYFGRSKKSSSDLCNVSFVYVVNGYIVCSNEKQD